MPDRGPEPGRGLGFLRGRFLGQTRLGLGKPHDQAQGPLGVRRHGAGVEIRVDLLPAHPELPAELRLLAALLQQRLHPVGQGRPKRALRRLARAAGAALARVRAVA